MRWLFWWFRSWFCRHAWQYDEDVIEYVDAWTGRHTRTVTRVSATCKGCGWHRKYRKF